MARLPALIAALADLDGRPRSAINHYARTIREAGFIQTTKRGVGAAAMTARDAAALVIGLYGAQDAASSASTVEAFQALPIKRTRSPYIPPLVKSFSQTDSLIDALAAIIELAPRIVPHRVFDDYERIDKISLPVEARGFDVQVSFYRPLLHAELQVSFYGVAEAAALHIVQAGAPDRSRTSAYEVVTTVNSLVFVKLHGILFPAAEREPEHPANRQ